MKISPLHQSAKANPKARQDKKKQKVYKENAKKRKENGTHPSQIQNNRKPLRRIL